MIMNRIILAFVMVWWTVTLLSLPSSSEITSEIGIIISEWYKAFSLPLWSIIIVGMWHDIGRMIWHRWITLDDNLPSSMVAEWITFVLWMSVIFTFVAYVHIALSCFVLVFLIPLFAVLLKDWLIMAWAETPAATSAQLVLVVAWLLGGATVHFLLSTAFNSGLAYLSNMFM